MDEVREYLSNTSQLWREDDWLRRLVKSHSEGLALSHHTFRPFNELQTFLWKALGQGLVIREIYSPFTRAISEADESQGVARDESPRQEVESELTPPFRKPVGEPMSYGPQEAGEPQNLGSRDAAARGVGRSRRTAAAGAGSSRSGLSYRHGEHGPATPLATSEA